MGIKVIVADSIEDAMEQIQREGQSEKRPLIQNAPIAGDLAYNIADAVVDALSAGLKPHEVSALLRAYGDVGRNSNMDLKRWLAFRDDVRESLIKALESFNESR